METPTISHDQNLVRRDQLPLSNPYAAPRTITEQRLGEIWRSVLSMDRVGIHDSYHDLGGDSLLAIAIFNMIERSFSIIVPVATLLEAPTIAELAQKLDDLYIRNEQ